MTAKNSTREFWNSRAESFPRFEAGADTYEARMLQLARDNGVDFHGKSILDVGCGSGMYTIRLAQEAASVTAVDISDEMLRILMQDAAAQGLANIRPVLSDWEHFALEERFQIVFASMTPALSDDAAREKLQHYALEQVVFMGFTERKTSDVMAGLYTHYGITPPQFADAPDMRAWLESQRIQYAALPVDGQWVVPHTHDKLMGACAANLRARGAEPDMRHLAAHLEGFRNQNGEYVERTEYSLEMLIWRTS
ncbi:MAG TPA: class I SAM-dependent methyltransferase [Desulfovibrio sp.]|uniref:class I SAM-dependent methyltransferase n=1 Tax=Desulfovibrio sp. TaxID=885 RepID=UPI002D3094DC|nr:class I SAM-dependent methyltransferase [Desulfovibrio sp.]HZF61600.1 class I SAM-dependent methyltransferase [Desulfovibrio sp.]